MSKNALARTKQTIATETHDADTKHYLAKAAKQFPFQGRIFAPLHTFQPQLTITPWVHSSNRW